MIGEGMTQKRLGKPFPVPGTKEKVTDLVIVHDPNKCKGCGECMIGCAYKHFKTFDTRYALLYVYEDPLNKGRYINANCSHCVFPMCLAACPKETIKLTNRFEVAIPTRDDASGHVLT